MLRPRARRAGCAVVLSAALAAGCRTSRRDKPDSRPAEVLVEVLPRDARVSLDGRPLGVGSRSHPAPPSGDHVLSVEARGYEPVARRLPEGDLAGARVAEALRPLGFAAGALDYDDAEGLALAAAFLLEAGDARDAADYAGRAVAVAPSFAPAHRTLGDALLRLGSSGRAIEAWSEYLRLAPDAPDAAEVGLRIERARDDAR